MSGTGHAVRVPGATLHVEERGHGPPVLFLGGSNWDLRTHRAAFGWLPGHRLVSFDHRGLGRSVPDDATTPFTMEDYRRDALAVLDALGIERADLVGYSFGAMVAQHVAADAPARVDRLALIAAGPGGPLGSWPIHTLAALPARERARRLLEIQDVRLAAVGADDAAVAALAERLERATADSPENGPARLLAARATHDAREALARIRARTLVIGGRHDGQAPPGIVAALATGIRDARLVMLDGGHGFVNESDGPLARVVEAWTTGR